MSKDLQVIYPKETTLEEAKLTERAVKESAYNQSNEDILTAYKKLLTAGFSINTTFKLPEDTNEDEETDVFRTARNLTMSGIPYKATLKLKEKPSGYESVLAIAKIFDQYNFDYEIASKLKINENSVVDFADEKTWFDTDSAEYKLNPKASSDNIMEFKNIFDDLTALNVVVDIVLKPKVKKDVDELFETQLDNFPDGTLVVLRLKDADLNE